MCVRGGFYCWFITVFINGERFTRGSDILNIYSAALVSLILAVWAVVQFCRWGSPVERINELIHRNSLFGRIVDDYVYRTIVFTYISFISNVLLGIGKGISGWLSQSWMLISLSVYYLLLCFTKFLLLRNSRKLPNQCRREQQEWKAYRVCGTLLMVMTIALLGIVILIVTRNSRFVYNGNLIYVVAMVDFYCLISAIVYMVRHRGQYSPIVVAIKTIQFATALVSMLY